MRKLQGEHQANAIVPIVATISASGVVAPQIGPK